MNKLRSFFQGSRGFSLAEVLVVVGVITIIMGTIGTALFQSLKTETVVRADGLAINELRKGLSWIAEDIKMAKSTNLVNGGPATSTATLTWTDEFADVGTSHSSTYALVSDRLVRTYDGNSHTVARKVVSVAFSLATSTVTAQIEVDAGAGTTRVLSVKALMRPAP